MKNYILSFVYFLVGIGAGIGIWHYITAPQLAKQQTQIDELQTKAETAASESKKKNAKLEEKTKENARLKKELSLEKSKQRALNSMVIKTKTELQALKRKSATQSVPVESKQPEQKTNTSAILTSSNTTTREYIVKNGDSCWKIAANELGDGSRYTEIIELNGLPKNPKLDIGMKLKIPVK